MAEAPVEEAVAVISIQPPNCTDPFDIYGLGLCDSVIFNSIGKTQVVRFTRAHGYYDTLVVDLI